MDLAWVFAFLLLTEIAVFVIIFLFSGIFLIYIPKIAYLVDSLRFLLCSIDNDTTIPQWGSYLL